METLDTSLKKEVKKLYDQGLAIDAICQILDPHKIEPYQDTIKKYLEKLATPRLAYNEKYMKEAFSVRISTEIVKRFQKIGKKIAQQLDGRKQIHVVELYRLFFFIHTQTPIDLKADNPLFNERDVSEYLNDEKRSRFFVRDEERHCLNQLYQRYYPNHELVFSKSNNLALDILHYFENMDDKIDLSFALLFFKTHPSGSDRSFIRVEQFKNMKPSKLKKRSYKKDNLCRKHELGS